MKKVVAILAVLFLFMGTVNAQQGQMHLGAGLELGLPIGDWSDAAGTGIGGTARFEYAFNSQIVGMLTAGYISFGGDEVGGFSYSYSAIPFLPGVKYYFQPGLYGMAELGLHFFSVDIEYPEGFGSFFAVDGSSSSSEFSLCLGAGYETKVGDNLILDANVKFAVVSNANYLGARVGVKMPIGN
ncbi:MAG: outer membrane beta-barrel protein [Ignavibacteriae bacterium]|nr:outer membrane beta-barrel protein [Ignavibacteriota bacterium]MCB9208076.1 outer membrane beta-barrel protein [Ignavibacteriales bacterium]MCB9258842.1 outer membrane beta-barrel protein [Ignavibacteriales bacterium]